MNTENDCHNIGISGNCGLTCPVLERSDCDEPHDFLEWMEKVLQAYRQKGQQRMICNKATECKIDCDTKQEHPQTNACPTTCKWGGTCVPVPTKHICIHIDKCDGLYEDYPCRQATPHIQDGLCRNPRHPNCDKIGLAFKCVPVSEPVKIEPSELQAAKDALAQTSLTGIYTEFDGLADAIQQMACYAIEQERVAFEFIGAFSDVADIVGAPEMWALDGLHLVTDKVQEMKAEYALELEDLNGQLCAKDHEIAGLELENEEMKELYA